MQLSSLFNEEDGVNYNITDIWIKWICCVCIQDEQKIGLANRDAVSHASYCERSIDSRKRTFL
eukprot:snap_masked-scaffold_3-processed-gene-16.58-mRNA-1 protein AED:1.00 eAED:1.00 QI:0/-1/0/0/-1/1/1/0/62